jgi:DNA-binding response OmpR family regulator
LESAILVLLVEGDATIGMMLEETLTDEGFTLVLASDGNTAIAELDADAARFQGVVTEISLGAGADGWEVARHAREIVPAMPIIYMTGGDGHEWAAKGVPKSVLVPKPFVPAQIITAISNLLNASDGH